MNKKIIGIWILGLLVTCSFSVSAGVWISSDPVQADLSETCEPSFMVEPPFKDHVETDYAFVYENQEDDTDPDVSTVTFSEEVAGLIWQIDESLVRSYIQVLVSFGPRVTGTGACYAAGDYIYGQFQSMGLYARTQYWEYGSYDGNNIEATLPGRDPSSDQIFIVCGHYDSVPGSPGADDNAAGTAAVLAAAAVMSQFSFRHTVRFVAFSGEEQGLLGSDYYASEAAAKGDNIQAVLNADMIGYAETEEDRSKVELHDGSGWMTTYTQNVGNMYYDLIGLTVIGYGAQPNSDHWPFLQQGYDAAMYHEYHFNPYYHSPEDTIDKMDMDYDMRVTRLITATLAELAIPVVSGGGGGGNKFRPTVRITSPISGEIVGDMVNITGIAFDFDSEIKYVFVQIGTEEWEGAGLERIGEGRAEWALPWDTTQFDDGSIVISAVSIDSGGKQSSVHYVDVIINNTVPEPPKIPDLESSGSLKWQNVTPAETVTGSFTVENVGDLGSSLNWSIDEFPSWGIWTFTPSQGTDLQPAAGPFAVQVSVVVPNEQKQQFDGEIRIINTENTSDYEIITVALTTPKNKSSDSQILKAVKEHTLLFSLLGRLFD